MHSVAVHDLAAAVLGGELPSPGARRRAFAAPLHIWRRVLGFEGCAVQFDHALIARGIEAEAPAELRAMLRAGTAQALQHGLLVLRQVPVVARIAGTHGIELMALKGAARLLGGEPAGRRSIADIDILVRHGDAPRFHELLRRDLGYASVGPASPHHLPALVRPGQVGIELHFRLGPDSGPLDERIWSDARSVELGGASIAIPSPTSLLLHTLDHAAAVNWVGRYRLRDLCDLAQLGTADVSSGAVAEHIRGSTAGHAMTTLLTAAAAMRAPGPPSREAMRACATVRRVSAFRIALAVLPKERLAAERVFRYAGVLAEGSPRTVARAAIELGQRGVAALRQSLGALVSRRILPPGVGVPGRSAGRRRPAAALVAALLLGCSDATGSGSDVISDFVFTSAAGGTRGIHRFSDGVVTRLSALDHEDAHPQSAAGRIVFASRRDGNREVYIADLALGEQQRLTSDPWDDAEPSLHPGGGTIAFVSNRSGTPRVWTMNADGSGQQLFATGSSGFVPEGAPAWSPSGEYLAFTSTRTGTAQVFVVAAAGGSAAQVTHEAMGAFQPAWSSDGSSVVYTTVAGSLTVRVVPRGGGDWEALAASDGALSDAACRGSLCLMVAGESGRGEIVRARPRGGVPHPVTIGVPDAGEPAFLVR